MKTQETEEIRNFSWAIEALARNATQEVSDTIERLTNGIVDRSRAIESRAIKVEGLLSYLEEELKNRRPDLSRCRELIQEAKIAYL